MFVWTTPYTGYEANDLITLGFWSFRVYIYLEDVKVNYMKGTFTFSLYKYNYVSLSPLEKCKYLSLKLDEIQSSWINRKGKSRLSTYSLHYIRFKSFVQQKSR